MRSIATEKEKLEMFETILKGLNPSEVSSPRDVYS